MSTAPATLIATSASTETTVVGLDFDACYRVISGRDPRFDGVFYTAVATTGIYCRPSCPAITPRPNNVSFHPTAASAQTAGYRACRRCLPDAVPGSPRWNVESDLAARAMRLIADGVIERHGVAGLAAQLGYSSRQLGRVLIDQLGAGPLALARAHRAATARILIQNSDLPFSDVAFAAGYASIRQFNDSVREVFAQTPTQLRQRGAGHPGTGVVSLRLPVRQPFARSWSRWFLRAHAVDGVEHYDDGWYRRALRLPHGTGVVAIDLRDPEPAAKPGPRSPTETGFVPVELALDSMRDLAVAVARVRHLLDLDADPIAIDTALAAHEQFADLITATPGIRSFGSVDSAELLLRTMIGQQISIAAARTHHTRLAAALGDPIDHSVLTHHFPTAATVAERGHEVLSGPRRRIAAIVAVATALADQSLTLHPGLTMTEARERLLSQPGIGPWTANYVAMRVTANPDTLLSTDLVIKNSAQRLGINLTDGTLHPWATYAGMHLWHNEIQIRSPKPRDLTSPAH